MPTAIVYSNTGRGSGFGRIAAGIATALGPNLPTHVVGLGPSRATEGWQGHAHHPDDDTGTFRLRELVTELRPAVVLLVGAGSLAAWQAELLRHDGFDGTLAAYLPLEGRIWNPEHLRGLLLCSVLVTYTHSAARALTLALQALGPVALPRITTIPHAIEAAPPVPETRPALRQALFPAFAAQAGHTWLLNANRNDERKLPELTLRAFAEVVARRPATTLVLHGGVQRPGLDLHILRDELGLRRNVIFSRTEGGGPAGPWSEQALAQLYRCCEIGVNTAAGEGWGLIAFEHALHGGAQVMPAHEGLREIWGTAPQWVALGAERGIDEVFAGHLPAADDLARQLLHLVDNTEALLRVATACASHARQAAFGWAAVGAHWRELLA